MGVGSAIQRCGQTSAQNNNLHAVDYTSDDRFCYQGQQLVVDSGDTYGADNSEYRTAMDGFSRIIADTSSGVEPDSFTVGSRDGLTLYFGDWDGSSADAFIEAQGKTVADRWLLKRVEDRSGNYMEYNYTKDLENSAFNGDYRPTSIEYTLNDEVSPVLGAYAKVDFEYEARTDVVVRYRAGSQFKQAKRLSNIKTYVDADFNGTFATGEWVRDVQLTYEEVDATDFPRLSDITLCVPDGAGTDCSLPTEFDWVEEDNGYTIDSGWSGQAPATGALEKWADFNGDGRMDYATSSGATHYVSLTKSDGSEYETAATWTAYAKGDTDYETLADLNGDGLPDYITVDNNTTDSTHYWALSNGSNNYTKPGPYTGPLVDLINDDVQQLSDFNGDGLTDYLLASGTTYTVLLNNAGAGYQISQSWSGGPDLGASTVESHSFHDVNRDGRTDLVTIDDTTHSVYINTDDLNGDGTKTDPGFKAAQTWTAHDDSAAGGYWVDLNGDGLMDYVTIGTGTDSNKHYVSLSNGNDYYAPTTPWYANALDSGRVPVFRDINGDGITDYVSADINGDHKLSLSNGRNGYNNVLWAASAAFGDGSIYDFVDLDGNGKLDFVSTNSNGTHNVALNNSKPIHLMTKVTDGLGVETEFIYAPLTDTTVYTKGTSANVPTEMDVINSSHVVATLHHSDGTGGVLSASYLYEGFKFERGRGSLGFAKVTVTDLDRGTKVISEYEQAWPKTGMLKHNEVRLTSNNRLLKESDLVYGTYNSASPFNTLTEFNAIKSQTDKLYDADDGRHLTTITTTYTDDSDLDNIDGYGNRERTTVEVVDKEDSDKSYETVSTRTITNDSTNWLLGQVTQTKVQKKIDGTGNTAFDRTTDFTYDSKGRLKTTTREPSDTDDEYFKTTLYYDNDTGTGFGNLVKEEVAGHASATDPITTRDEEVAYDARGRFAVTLTNAEGHQQTQTYYEDLGRLKEVTGTNGLKTTRFYDNFGRLVKEDRPDGTYSKVGYYEIDWVTYPTPTGIDDRTDAAVYTEVAEYEDNTTETLAGAPIRLFADHQGRSLRQRVKGLEGTFIHSDTEYDSQGRVKQTSEPYFDTTGVTIHWNTPAYDAVNRVVGVTAADTTQDTTTDYDGFDVSVTDNQSRTITQIKNAIGQLMEVQDAQTNRTTYEYNIAGHLTKIQTGVTATTYDTEVVNTYDRLGRRLTMDDPDTGVITTIYNALSEVTEKETPELYNNTQSVTYSYDLLGRLTDRTEPETAGGTVDLISSWTYDDETSGNLGVGKLFEEKLERDDGTTIVTKYTRTQYHDATDAGKLSTRETDIEGTAYTVDWIYDDAGRVSQVLYPNSPSYTTTPLTMEYYYNPRGYLEQVYEAGQSATPIYQVTDVDAQGRITEEYLGDESLTGMGYMTGSGRLLYTHASRDNSGTQEDIQNLVYQYDDVGNMLARSDLLNDLTETFTYDALDRLTSSQVSDATTTQDAVDYYYNAMGNLTTKGDVGTYTYPSLPNTDPRPHAVTGVSFNGGGSATYTYDNNGNMTGGDGRTLTWYSFDKPKSINKNGNTRDFYYGPDRGRYKQVHNSTTKHYIEDSLVTVNAPGGTVETWEMTVFANGQAVAIVKDEDNSGTVTKTTSYLHRDHLGSIAVVTDLNGSTLNIENLSYDAFGKRRDATDWVGAPGSTPTLTRGYTGHEHLDDVDVIHMNGRIYDPELGRMLSPDPVIQAPTVSQNYNRYSYVLNNPLKYTDPSGYLFGISFKRILNFVVKQVVKAVLTLVCGPEANVCYQAINNAVDFGANELARRGNNSNSRGRPNSGNSSRPGPPGGGPDPAELLPNFTIGTGGSSPVQGIAPGQATDVTSVTPGSLTTQPDFPDPPVVNNGESSGAIQTLAGGVSDAGGGVVTINDSPGSFSLLDSVFIEGASILVAQLYGENYEAGQLKTWDPVTDQRIGTLNPKVQGPATDFINQVQEELGINLRISQATRTIDEQDALYNQGRTEPGNIVTNAKGGESYHNYGLAIDVVEIRNRVAIYDTNWEAISEIGKRNGFEWGGDWTNPDLPHFQMPFDLSIEELQSGGSP